MIMKRRRGRKRRNKITRIKFSQQCLSICLFVSCLFVCLFVCLFCVCVVVVVVAWFLCCCSCCSCCCLFGCLLLLLLLLLFCSLFVVVFSAQEGLSSSKYRFFFAFMKEHLNIRKQVKTTKRHSAVVPFKTFGGHQGCWLLKALALVQHSIERH